MSKKKNNWLSKKNHWEYFVILVTGGTVHYYLPGRGLTKIVNFDPIGETFTGYLAVMAEISRLAARELGEILASGNLISLAEEARLAAKEIGEFLAYYPISHAR